MKTFDEIVNEPHNVDLSTMNTRKALVMAYNETLDPSVQAMIAALLTQRGCRHFDPACRDDHLTTLCDIVVFG